VKNELFTAIFLFTILFNSCGLIEQIDEETSTKYGGEITIVNQLKPFTTGYDAVITIDYQNKGLLKYMETKTYSVTSDGMHLIKAQEPNNVSSYSFGMEWKISLYGGEKKTIIIK